MKPIHGLAIVAGLALTAVSYAYDDAAHKSINNAAALQSSTVVSAVDIDRALKDALWAPAGLDTRLGVNKARKWVEFGGPAEDSLPWRPVNHFLDPLHGGYRDGGLWWGRSAAYWATNDNAVDWVGYTPVQTSGYGGNFSWQAALRNYFVGVTGYYVDDQHRAAFRIVPKAKDRERYLADAFRSLGQVMHLVADMASPAHVRGDAHPARCAAIFRRPDWTSVSAICVLTI